MIYCNSIFFSIPEKGRGSGVRNGKVKKRFDMGKDTRSQMQEISKNYTDNKLEAGIQLGKTKQ